MVEGHYLFVFVVLQQEIVSLFMLLYTLVYLLYFEAEITFISFINSFLYILTFVMQV